MKKKVFISVLIVIIILISAVTIIFIYRNNDDRKTNTQSSTTETATIHTPTQINNVIIPNTSNWKTDGLTALGLTNAKTSNATDCLQGNVYIISEPDFGIFSNFYIALETKENVLITYIGTSVDSQSPHNKVSFSDVDGEPGEEIIINADTGGNGGYGQYTSSVWKLSDKGIENIFEACTIVGLFDTGFESELQEPFKLIISNKYTGYKTTIDYSNKSEYIGTIFDKNGKPLSNSAFTNASFDSFYFFEPIDIDNDGVFEIMCKQYTSLHSHVDHIGDAQTIIKYDKSKKDFKIIDTEFIEYSEDETT